MEDEGHRSSRTPDRLEDIDKVYLSIYESVKRELGLRGQGSEVDNYYLTIIYANKIYKFKLKNLKEEIQKLKNSGVLTEKNIKDIPASDRPYSKKIENIPENSISMKIKVTINEISQQQNYYKVNLDLVYTITNQEKVEGYSQNINMSYPKSSWDNKDSASKLEKLYVDIIYETNKILEAKKWEKYKKFVKKNNINIFYKEDPTESPIKIKTINDLMQMFYYFTNSVDFAIKLTINAVSKINDGYKISGLIQFIIEGNTKEFEYFNEEFNFSNYNEKDYNKCLKKIQDSLKDKARNYLQQHNLNKYISQIENNIRINFTDAQQPIVTVKDLIYYFKKVGVYMES